MKERKQSIAILLKRIEKVEYELSDIRKCIAEFMSPPVEGDGEMKELDVYFTLEDLWEAFGRKHKSYAMRLRKALEQRGVTTLPQFLAMSPGQLLNLDGIGPGTLEYTNKALKHLGITW